MPTCLSYKTKAKPFLKTDIFKFVKQLSMIIMRRKDGHYLYFGHGDDWKLYSPSKKMQKFLSIAEDSPMNNIYRSCPLLSQSLGTLPKSTGGVPSPPRRPNLSHSHQTFPEAFGSVGP